MLLEICSSIEFFLTEYLYYDYKCKRTAKRILIIYYYTDSYKKLSIIQKSKTLLISRMNVFYLLLKPP